MSTKKLRSERTGIWDGTKRLSTFRAKILKETAIYDRDRCVGRVLTLERRLDEQQQTFEIDANDLNKIGWIAKYVGIPDEVCLVSAKVLAKAIISLSKTGKRLVRRYVSMGFQTIDGQPVYVHGGGVLVPSGVALEDVEARLSDAFAGYGFPDPSLATVDRADYLAAPLELLKVSKKNRAIGVIALGSAVRAVLCGFHPSVVTPILIGESGAGKSEMLALATSFFRPGTDVNSLPFNLTSSPKGLRQRAAESAHTMFPLDDYFPSEGNSSENAEFVEMLILGGSTTARRQTAKSATEAESAAGIETVVMLTGEVALVTDKESRHARAFYCEVGGGDVDAERRVACLEYADKGDFARAMQEFIIGCLSRYDRLKDSVPDRFDYYQRKAKKKLPGLHPRHWLNVADIMLGVHFYLRFCRKEGIIDEKRDERLRQRSWEALIDLAKAQRSLVQRYSRDGVVDRAFENLLKDGKYHLRAVGTDDLPKGVPADRVGWLDGERQGTFLGFVDVAAQKIYVPTKIDAEALFRALPLDAQKLLARGPKLLWKRMTDLGLVQPGEDGRNASKVPRVGPGRVYTLSIRGLFR